MVLSHFNEFVILSGMYILAPYQMKGCAFCNGSIILIWYLCFYELIMILEDENNIYFIFYFLHAFVLELIIVSMLSVTHEILQNSNPFT